MGEVGEVRGRYMEGRVVMGRYGGGGVVMERWGGMEEERELWEIFESNEKGIGKVGIREKWGKGVLGGTGSTII